MTFVQIAGLLGAGIAIGFGAIGSAIGEGIIAMRATQALGRQPQAGPQLLKIMIIGQAITETAAIFALVMSLILVFNSPDAAAPLIKGFALLGAGIAIGFGTIGSGFGAGLPGGSAMDGIGRNPENADVLTVQMIIGQAVTQTSTIFALTISLILVTMSPVNTVIKIFALMGAAFAMGFGAIGPGIGDGFVAKNANTAVGNSPKHMGLLTRSMIIGQAVTETTDIYSLVVALILIFVV